MLITSTKVLSQKEAYWFSMRINFDSCKSDAARIMAQIDSVIYVESKALCKGMLRVLCSNCSAVALVTVAAEYHLPQWYCVKETNVPSQEEAGCAFTVSTVFLRHKL